MEFLIKKYHIFIKSNQFKTESGRISAIKYIVTRYRKIDKNFVYDNLKYFESENGIYKFLKAVVEINNLVMTEIMCELAKKWNTHFNVRIAKLLLKNIQLSPHFFKVYITLFPISNRLELANHYLINRINTNDDIIIWLSLLESVDDANYLLKKYNFNDSNKLLINAGYTIPHNFDNFYYLESDDESDSESDDIIDQNIMRFDLSDFISGSKYDEKYIRMIIPNSYIEYDVITGEIINAELILEDIYSDIYNSLIGFVINKINVYNEIESSKNKLYISSEWQDVQIADDSKQCVVCMNNGKQIIFNCGHYATCFKCSRQIIKGNKKCPMCNTIINSINRVFT